MLSGSGLPHRAVLRLLRCPSRPYRGGLRQHLGGGEGGSRLVVTSSIALEIVEHLDSQGHKIIWGPDRHLGPTSRRRPAPRCCAGRALHRPRRVQGQGPARAQGPEPGRGRAGAPGPRPPSSNWRMRWGLPTSSSRRPKELPQQKLIVATDRGIFYKMQQACPEKEMVEAPTGGDGATCRSCAHCPWMAMNGLVAIKEALTDGAGASRDPMWMKRCV